LFILSKSDLSTNASGNKLHGEVEVRACLAAFPEMLLHTHRTQYEVSGTLLDSEEVALRLED